MDCYTQRKIQKNIFLINFVKYNSFIQTVILKKMPFKFIKYILRIVIRKGNAKNQLFYEYNSFA